MVPHWGESYQSSGPRQVPRPPRGGLNFVPSGDGRSALSSVPAGARKPSGTLVPALFRAAAVLPQALAIRPRMPRPVSTARGFSAGGRICTLSHVVSFTSGGRDGGRTQKSHPKVALCLVNQQLTRSLWRSGRPLAITLRSVHGKPDHVRRSWPGRLVSLTTLHA